MFDPSGLKDRYSELVDWQGGMWVNYWTQTVPRSAVEDGAQVHNGNEAAKEEQVADNDLALLATGIPGLPGDRSSQVASTSSPPALPPRPSASRSSGSSASPENGPSTQSEAKAAQKAQEKAMKEHEKQRKQAEKVQAKEAKRLQKQREADAKSARKAERDEKDKDKAKPGRHFIVLPTGLGQVLGGDKNWEKVLIGGVEDEVAAHTGLFIRGQNLDYDGLVERVGKKVLGWCEKI